MVALPALVAPVAAQTAAPASAADIVLGAQVQQFALEASRNASASHPGLRVEVRVGQLDPRLRLAPCDQVQPYLPPNTKLWGASRIGLRCADPGVRWNVYLPVTVDVWGQAVVAGSALPAGSVIAAGDLRRAEVNLAQGRVAPLQDGALAIGRTLARPIAAGVALHANDLRVRQWFAAGDVVRIVATGKGWRISSEGLALAPGIEGRQVRVRAESGRVISGIPVAERLIEIPL